MSNVLDQLVKEANEKIEVEKVLTDFVLPSQPGDTFWYIENFAGTPLNVKSSVIKMIGFTTTSILVTPIEDNSKFGNTKMYTWGITAFHSQEEAQEAFNMLLEKTPNFLFKSSRKAKADSTISE